jgi:arylsulfatase A
MLRGEKQPERDFLYREFAGYGGQQFVRMGNWKLVRRMNLTGEAKPRPKSRLSARSFYNIATDPAETKNVAAGAS